MFDDRGIEHPWYKYDIQRAMSKHGLNNIDDILEAGRHQPEDIDTQYLHSLQDWWYDTSDVDGGQDNE
jgi:hypothetical protein